VEALEVEHLLDAIPAESLRFSHHDAENLKKKKKTNEEKNCEKKKKNSYL